MDTMQVSAYFIKFLQSFRIHISFSYSCQDSNERELHKAISGDGGKSRFLQRIIGSNSSSSIHQENQELRNNNLLSDGKNKSGTLATNNNSLTKSASSTLCSKIEEHNRELNGFHVWQKPFYGVTARTFTVGQRTSKWNTWCTSENK